MSSPPPPRRDRCFLHVSLHTGTRAATPCTSGMDGAAGWNRSEALTRLPTRPGDACTPLHVECAVTFEKRSSALPTVDPVLGGYGRLGKRPTCRGAGGPPPPSFQIRSAVRQRVGWSDLERLLTVSRNCRCSIRGCPPLLPTRSLDETDQRVRQRGGLAPPHHPPSDLLDHAGPPSPPPPPSLGSR